MNNKIINNQENNNFSTNDKSSNINNFEENGINQNDFIIRKLIIRKSDNDDNTIFEKDFSDVNEAVAECCECNSADKSVKAPQFENNQEGTSKASEWLSNNNKKYNFDILDNDSQISNKATTSSDINKNNYAGNEVGQNSADISDFTSNLQNQHLDETSNSPSDNTINEHQFDESDI